MPKNLILDKKKTADTIVSTVNLRRGRVSEIHTLK